MRNNSGDDSLTHQLAPLFRRVSHAHNQALKPCGLRAAEAHIWLCLDQGGAMTVGQLQALLGLRGSTLTGALDRLERRDLIQRRFDESDRRSTVLTAAKMTDAWRAGVRDAVRAADAACWGGLSADEQTQLYALLEKANTNFGPQE